MMPTWGTPFQMFPGSAIRASAFSASLPGAISRPVSPACSKQLELWANTCINQEPHSCTCPHNKPDRYCYCCTASYVDVKIKHVKMHNWIRPCTCERACQTQMYQYMVHWTWLIVANKSQCQAHDKAVILGVWTNIHIPCLVNDHCANIHCQMHDKAAYLVKDTGTCRLIHALWSLTHQAVYSESCKWPHQRGEDAHAVIPALW